MSNENSTTNSPLLSSSKCKNPTRYYGFTMITYLNEDELLKVLQNINDNIRAFAYIFHDKDIGKEPHFHLLLSLYNACTISAICKKFKGFIDSNNGLEKNTLAEIPLSWVKCFDYLTHKNEPEKYQYDESLIVCNNIDFFNGEVIEKQDNVAMAVEDLLAGVSVRQLCKRYGRDFIIHSRSILNVVEMIRYEEYSKKSYIEKEMN